MKPIKLAALVAVLISTLLFAVFINRSVASKSISNYTVRGDGFAVLELFTSEGCSSCPAADELLARIQKDAGDKPVYVLSYHVDYWNRLGWKDIFSQPQFSKRQYQYSHQFSGQVYTPQLIVNGKAEFIGSDESAIRPAINDALTSPSSTTLALHAEQQGTKINVSYMAKGNAANDQLLLAIVQKHAISKVSKGENEGLTLHHAQIVRNFYTYSLAPNRQGLQQIDMPAGFSPNEWEIIGLLQDPQTGAIDGATRALVEKAGSAL